MSTLGVFQRMYPSPLSVYKGQELPELSNGVNSDGKSLDNGPIVSAERKSTIYETYPLPIKPREQGNAFDFHSKRLTES